MSLGRGSKLGEEGEEGVEPPSDEIKQAVFPFVERLSLNVRKYII